MTSLTTGRGVAATAADRPKTPPTDTVMPVGAADTARAEYDAEFAAFMSASADDLGRTAWLLCGDRHRAEELTQQALVRTYLKWSNARQGDPLAYARRVLANLRIDSWRKHRKEVLTAAEELPERSTAATNAADAGLAERDRLIRALMTLSPRRRRIVVLRHLVGMREIDVARDLGISVGTVKSTASRSLAQLRAALAEADATDVHTEKREQR
jgi:RNA polymerase sigma-70 factor (sigma-E family)